MRILVLSNLTSYTYNFRLEILQALLDEGHSVMVASHNDDDAKQREMACLGLEMIEVPFNGKGKNPMEELSLLLRYRKLIRKTRPDMVFTFTIKMNLYGGLVAKRRHIPYVPMITGLGELEKKGRLQAVLMKLHKMVMPGAKAVLFQNQANMDFFRDNGIETRRGILIPGSGINLNKFQLVDYPSENDGLKFAFIGRITPAKGVSEYLLAAKLLKAKHPEFTFYMAGLCDEEYKGAVQELDEKGVVKYLGMLSDTRELLSKIHCLVLPTYHPEGLSNVLLEACATGRPCICTSRPGCREVVKDGVNGLYCKAQDVDNLMDVIESFAAMTEERRRKMGLEGRDLVQSSFDRKIVVQRYMELLR